MPKAERACNQDGDLVGYMVGCPGCEQAHLLYTVPWTHEWTEKGGTKRSKPGPVWAFNGDVNSPTFTPSLLCNKSWPERRCHSHIRAGQIQFLDDCFHALKGQTVDLPSDDW